jgi:hypothetical protein
MHRQMIVGDYIEHGKPIAAPSKQGGRKHRAIRLPDLGAAAK